MSHIEDQQKENDARLLRELKRLKKAVTHKHINYHSVPHYPGGGKMYYNDGSVFSGNFDVNLCNNMSISKGTKDDSKVTCPECLVKLKKGPTND